MIVLQKGRDKLTLDDVMQVMKKVLDGVMPEYMEDNDCKEAHCVITIVTDKGSINSCMWKGESTLEEESIVTAMQRDLSKDG